MNRKKIGLLVLCVSMLFTMAACSSKDANKDNQSEAAKKGDTQNTEGNTTKETKTEITVWAWDPAYNIAALNEAKAIYENENPEVTVVIEEMAKADLEQKLHTILASGQKDTLPDVVLIEDLNAIKYINSYPGAFVPYNNVDYSQFATPVDFMTIDGQTYGVPFGLATTGMYYRLDYIEEAGYTEEDMQNITWEQYIEIGKAVKEKTGHNMLTLDPNDGGLVRVMMQSAGAWFTDMEGNITIKDNVALQESFKVMQAINDAGIAKLISGWADFVGGFNSGEIASVVTGCWITPSIIAEESQNELWRVAPTPRLSMEGSVNASNLGGSSWYVLNGTGNEEVGMDFVAKTFAGSTALYETLLDKYGIASMYSPAFDSEIYQKPQEFFGGQKVNADFAAWSKDVPAVNFGAYTWEADAVVMNALSEVLNGADINAALENAEEQFKLQIQ